MWPNPQVIENFIFCGVGSKSMMTWYSLTTQPFSYISFYIPNERTKRRYKKHTSEQMAIFIKVGL